MRILILGNNYSARVFLNFFKENKENIVFSTIKELNYIEIDNPQDALDFCQANDINLVLITDENYIFDDYQEFLNDNNVAVFSPTSEALSVCYSKSCAKKFMYKNKISAPKFFIAEKPQLALDYIKTANFPLAIKPENNSFQECPVFCETQKQAQETINNFFANGNKKVIIEDYIEGKNVSIWTISNGFDAKIIGSSAKYQNNIALFNPDFLTNDLKEEIFNEIIMPTISGLSNQDEEYIGILGFDIILNRKNEPYLIGYNSFFDELNIDFYTNNNSYNWENIFVSTIVGDVFQKFSFDMANEFMLNIRQENELCLICSLTKNGLEKKLNELEFDLKEFCEAKKIWNY